MELNFNSVETIPVLNASAAFKTDSGKVFKEDVDIVPTIIDKSLSYIPWGSDNNMPYHIINLIESDETLATCQMFNAEVCYGSGLQYNTDSCGGDVKREVEDFLLDNALPSYFLGVCQDFKHFAFCVSVVILNAEGTRIVRLIRKEACYCRLTPAEKDGSIRQVLYANWRQPVASRDDIEVIDLLDINSPWRDLAIRMGRIAGDDGKRRVRTKSRKFAVLTRVPTPDSTYYPIPYYGALFRGKWYNIKQLMRSRTSIGTPSSRARASPTAASSRNASSRRSSRSSTSLPAWRTLARCGSPPSMWRPQARSSTRSSSTRSTPTRRAATGQRTSRRR